MVDSIDVWVCKQNIERFQRQLLEMSGDRFARNSLMQLLVEEQTRLDQLAMAEKRNNMSM